MNMREKLDGITLAFRVSKSQQEVVERAMRASQMSNVSEFVRRTLLVECERLLEEHELMLIRRAQLRAEIEQADLRPHPAAAESPAPYQPGPPALPLEKKARQPGPLPRPRATG